MGAGHGRDRLRSVAALLHEGFSLLAAEPVDTGGCSGGRCVAPEGERDSTLLSDSTMADLDYDASGLVLARDGTRLFFGERGHGPPLLLLDGIGCEGWAWNRVQPALAGQHRVIHTHYRGHGRSGNPVDPKRIAIADLARDALTVLDGLGIDRCAIMAHSMGTQVSLEVLRAAPDRVTALVLVCGTAGNVTHTFHGNDLLHRILPTLTKHVKQYRPWVLALWRRMPAQLSYRIASLLGEVDGSSLDPRDFQQYVEHLSDMDLELYLDMLHEAGAHTAADLLPSIVVPTLVVAADQDTFTPRDVVKGVADAIPGAQYLELSGTHAAPGEQPEVLVERVKAFLADPSETRPT